MITVEALIILLCGFIGSHFTSSGFIGPYFDIPTLQILFWGLRPAGLILDLLGIGGFMALTSLSFGRLTEDLRYRTIKIISIMMFGTVALWSITGSWLASPYCSTHDSAIQSQVAAEMLIKGVNPYAVSFQGTIFEKLHPPRFDDKVNPVLAHYPYPPVTLLTAIVPVLLAKATTIYFDYKIISIGAFLVTVWLLLRLAPNRRTKSWVWLLILANPAVTIYPVTGFNDSLFVLGLVASAIMASRGHWSWSSVLMGLALATKQTVWFIWPLWLLWRWRNLKGQPGQRQEFMRTLLISGGTALAIYLPFLIWNGPALYDDLIRFLGGTIPHTFPISGDSLWQFFIVLKVLPSPFTTISPLPIQVVAMLFVYPLVSWWIIRRPTAMQWLTSSVVVVFVLGVTNRYFYENYIGALIMLSITVLVMKWAEERIEERQHKDYHT